MKARFRKWGILSILIFSISANSLTAIAGAKISNEAGSEDKTQIEHRVGNGGSFDEARAVLLETTIRQTIQKIRKFFIKNKNKLADDFPEVPIDKLIKLIPVLKIKVTSEELFDKNNTPRTCLNFLQEKLIKCNITKIDAMINNPKVTFVFLAHEVFGILEVEESHPENEYLIDSYPISGRLAKYVTKVAEYDLVFKAAFHSFDLNSFENLEYEFARRLECRSVAEKTKKCANKILFFSHDIIACRNTKRLAAECGTFKHEVGPFKISLEIVDKKLNIDEVITSFNIKEKIEASFLRCLENSCGHFLKLKGDQVCSLNYMQNSQANLVCMKNDYNYGQVSYSLLRNFSEIDFNALPTLWDYPFDMVIERLFLSVLEGNNIIKNIQTLQNNIGPHTIFYYDYPTTFNSWKNNAVEFPLGKNLCWMSSDAERDILNTCLDSNEKIHTASFIDEVYSE